MKNLYKIVFITLLFAFLNISISEACRFWIATGDSIPQKVVLTQLLEDPRSLKRLGIEYADGWSVGYYEDDVPIVFRSPNASNIDERYNLSVNDVAAVDPKLIFSHLRRASSGCVKGVPNPHPFEIFLNGKYWTFAHNGGIKKDLLINLIGEDYLASNAPQVCTDNPPDSWVDSELYFIFLLKHIQMSKTSVSDGIVSAMKILYKSIEEDLRYLNFYLTDGETIWSFRKGTSLSYMYGEDKKYTIVSSTIPNSNNSEWIEFPENHLAVMHAGKSLEFIDVTK